MLVTKKVTAGSPTDITHEQNISENHRSEPNLPGNFMELSRGVLDFRGVLLPQASGTSAPEGKD